jgi:RNA polymerase sigma factor (sigma-70 family)
MDNVMSEMGRRYKVLSKREQFAAFRKAKKGNKEASERLFWSVAPMAVGLAKRAARKYDVPFEQLVSAAFTGILECIHGSQFDPKRNVKFSTYVTWHIRKAIWLDVSSKSLVRLPRNMFWDFDGDDYRMQAANVRPAQVQVDDMQYCDDPLDTVMAKEKTELISQAISKLTPVEQEIICRTFYKGETLDEVAPSMNRTKQAIQQRRAKIIEKLRERLECEYWH